MSRISRTSHIPWIASSIVLAGLLVSSGAAHALEALDGRIQAHGYFEMQLRTMSADYSDQWDVSQWYNIFNVELEFDLVQDTHGPLDLLSAYVRLEGRFDCIYSRGCGMVQPIDAYGDRARKMPRRLNRGDNFTSAGQIPISNDGPYANDRRDPLRVEQIPGFEGIYDSTKEGLGKIDRQLLLQCSDAANGCPEDFDGRYDPAGVPVKFWQADRNKRSGRDNFPIDDGTQGAPFLMVMRDFEDFRFLSLPVNGGSNNGHANMLLGPWLPRNTVQVNAKMANQPNPLDNSRVVPQSLSPGAGANPMRPIPILREDDGERFRVFIRQTNDTPRDPDAETMLNPHWVTLNPADEDRRVWNDRAAQPWEARGLYMPSPTLKRALMEDKFGSYDFNFTQTERAFNRGASQQDEGELKEAYFDVELFDSRLWLRLGKQSIVWGKTELFRTTDQFNPQDLALATLPSLEESRINLWAARGVYSFYTVGPLDDLRLELAFNFDQFESADLGACGEPYAVNLVCAITFGSFAHGVTGVGVAGVVQPENPWDDIRGWELGGRLEFRWDRFSFALTDFYGYDDFPHPVRLTSYNRNVDWRSGRPRHYMHTLAQMRLQSGGVGSGCAAPDGKGVVFERNPDGSIDFTRPPKAAGVHMGYSGAGESGCLYPGPTNRKVGANGEPYRVSTGATNSQNKLRDYTGLHGNDTSRADPNDPRHAYSRATTSAPVSVTDWPEGPNAHLCETDSRLMDYGGPGVAHPDCANDKRGRRTTNAAPFLADGTTPNPAYNPYYVSRFDPNFTPDPSMDIAGNPGGIVSNFNYIAAPGDIIVHQPALYDPFRTVTTGVGSEDGVKLWANAYDPTLAYDSRNSLDLSAVNLSLFAWVCSTTVGFSDLDPSACAMTVFGSTRQADADGPRISFVISSFLNGDPGLNQFLGSRPSDKQLSKGSLLPVGMGLPVVKLHNDLSFHDPSSALPGTGLGAFRTTDVRRNWLDQANNVSPYNDPTLWIYSREAESYNCLPGTWDASFLNSAQLCGGLVVALQRTQPELRFAAATYVSKSFTPEQEALMGCGPFFGTSCDTNGLDLLWAEGSALLQSFIGADSRGISLAELGITGLVPDSFGHSLTDSGSPSWEYRTDGRVIGRNGELLRIDPTTQTPTLGFENGLRSVGTRASFHGDTECDYSLVGNGDALALSAPGGGLQGGQFQDGLRKTSAIHHRWNARCWDTRRYFVAYGIQPGTTAFELLGRGGPKCTTADIGGPLGAAGTLPGCRNKWATILYRPSDSWDPASGLHPNNPDAGYIGNNYLGQVMSYKAPRVDPSLAPNPRTDYRQYRKGGLDLEDLVACTTSPNLRDPADCYLANPQAGMPGYGDTAAVQLDSAWAANDPRYAAAMASRRSGLNWGVYWEDAGQADSVRPDGCPYEAGDPRARNEPDCYYGGWRQTVDGDPDFVGLQAAGLLYPKWVDAYGVPDLYDMVIPGLGNIRALVEPTNSGQRVENGCTSGAAWVFLQRTADNQLLSPPECANVFDGTGAGHPFTGESFASEMAGLSNNFMNVLVTFSDDFADGLASVQSFTQPWIYESRYIYDERWMWDRSCTVQTCGRAYGGRQYGNPNRDLNGEKLKDSTGQDLQRQRAGRGWQRRGLHPKPCITPGNPSGCTTEEQIRSRKINPLPAGVQNRLQRDPSVPNILDMFPDLLEYECDAFAPGAAHTPENCDSWNSESQRLRFGESTVSVSVNDPADPSRLGLVRSMLWDYAFTGTENDLMAMIPYCESLGYSQMHVQSNPIGAEAGADVWGPSRVDCTRGQNGETLGRERCTYVTPQFCDLVQALLSIAGQKRNIVRAGGNGTFGRRTMQWQTGGEVYLAYEKRNVLGFSTDFAEDFTKTNWGMEFTWIEGVPQVDNDSWDLTTKTNDFNLTVSVDRPTFINFLNANRTFFINSQWFFQYRQGYSSGMTSNGPFNVLATLAFFTGYFQDRLNPSMVFVYDFRSASGGALPQLNYRFSEAFSITVGAAMFMGRQEFVDMPVNGPAPASPRSGKWAYKDSVDAGLGIVRDRDEVFMTLRYTF